MTMKKLRKVSCIVILIIYICLLTGCWNYKEVEQLAIVSGVAVDKAGEDKVLITTEIVSLQQEQNQSKLKPIYVQAVGHTFFEAIRSMIAIQGKRMYWSHAKTVIISEELAKEGIGKYLDFIYRDAEVRDDMWVLLSKERTAMEIFNSKPTFENLVSFEIDDTMRAEESVSQYPAVELYEFIDKLMKKESSMTIPTVMLIENKGQTLSYVTGAAIIHRDKLVGYLNDADTKSLLWIQNKLRGGIYPIKNAEGTGVNVSLEIYKCNTKIRPDVIDDIPVINVKVLTYVNIGEIMGYTDFISTEGRNRLEKIAEAQIKKDIEELIEKAQKEYKFDFLDFGEAFRHYMPSVWKSIESEWDEVFTEIVTNVEVDVRVKASSTKSKPLMIGE